MKLCEELCVRIEQQFKDEVNVRNFVFIVGDNLRMKLM